MDESAAVGVVGGGFVELVRLEVVAGFEGVGSPGLGDVVKEVAGDGGFLRGADRYILQIIQGCE